MAKYLNTIKDEVRQLLKDEVGEDQDFSDPELTAQVIRCLDEISMRRPYEKKETLTTTASSLEVDISSIEGLIKVEKVEYPVGYEPPNYCNCSVFGNTLRFEYSSLPAGGQNIYLYCEKMHELTEESTTLNPQIEKVLIDGSVAYSALAWVNNVRSHVKDAVELFTDIDTAIDNMSARVTQAMADLTSGRSLINTVTYGKDPTGDYASYSSRELANASTYLNQSAGYLKEGNMRLAISNLISAYQAWANNKLALYQRELRLITKKRVKYFYRTA